MDNEIKLSTTANEFIKIQRESVDVINTLGQKIQDLSKNLQEFKKYGELSITLDDLIKHSKVVTAFTVKVEEAYKEVNNVQLLGTKIIETKIKFESINKELARLEDKLAGISEETRKINMEPMQLLLDDIHSQLTNLSLDYGFKLALNVEGVKQKTESLNEAIGAIITITSNNTREISDLKNLISEQNKLIVRLLEEAKK